ncbi:hypothetical protein [Kitasatospora nipponensis]|uniref:hypothetical protein n=1 Tax=Kitasatospora nipponensis TaxID=258049 RepID=UPI0031CE2436
MGRWGGAGPAPDGFGFLRSWLTTDEATCGDRQHQLRLFLARSFEIDPGTSGDSAFLDELETTPEFAQAVRTAAACHRLTDELSRIRPEFTVDRILPERIADLLIDHWGCTVADADFHALDRGFVKLAPRT